MDPGAEDITVDAFKNDALTADGSAAAAPTAPESGLQVFAIGDAVQFATLPSYLKTADPMPMLRPPDLVSREEVGRVVEIRPRGWLAVSFRRGTFLIAATDLRPVATSQSA